MKKTTRIAALLAAAALIFGGVFCSCSDDPEEDGGAPSPTLPASVGDNPITKEIRLSEYADSSEVLVMKTDGTAELRYKDDGDADYETEYAYKYTWNAEKQEIYMTVEKFSAGFEKPMTYDEIVRDLDTLLMKSFEADYENNKNENWFMADYPNVKSLDEFKQAYAEKEGYKSFNECLAAAKEEYLEYLKAIFGATITYGYETTDGSMTLTEKFTGIENMGRGRCRYSKNNVSIRINDASQVSYENSSAYYYGTANTEKKTIVFTLSENAGDGTANSVINASYTEDLENETVTVTIDGTSFVCEFEGETLTQRD